MSRSGYSDDCENIGLWRGAVARAFRGKRGQAFLRELRDTLDEMHEKRLLAVTINTSEGCCAMGAVTRARGIDTADIDTLDPYDDYGYSARTLAKRVGIARAMAQEIIFMNDEGAWGEEAPEQRWERMRKWVDDQIEESP